MKKGLLLFAAVVLMGLVAYTVWYINRRGELAGNSKDSFIPDNSALVISLNTGASLSEKIRTAFASDIRDFREEPLYKAVDTLISANFAAPTSRILAVRLEGKNKPVFLWVMDNRDVWSRSEIVTFLKGVFRVSREQVRKYGNYRIYSLNIGGKMLYYAVEEGMILLSGSELYVADALIQFERKERRPMCTMKISTNIFRQVPG